MTSILNNIPYYTTAKNKVTSWIVPTEFDFRKFSGGLMGVILTITIAELDIYKMLLQNIRLGDLPSYTTDVLIVVTSIIEALLGPYIAWYGIRSKRTTLVTWTSILAVISLTWYMIPNVDLNSKPENCFRSFVFTGYTSNSLTRLLILGVSSIVFSLIRVVAFTHGAAHMDHHGPKYISLHYGIFVIVRVLPLVLADKIFSTGVDNFSGSHIRSLIIGSFINLIQIIQAIPRDNTGEETLNSTELETESKEKDVTERGAEEKAEPKDKKETSSVSGTIDKETDIQDTNLEGIPENKDKDKSENDSQKKETQDSGNNSEKTESETRAELDKNWEQIAERDFYSSLKSVFSNKLVMYHALAMGLMAAALWGFGYNNEEIIKIKYFYDPKTNYDTTAELIRYAFVVILVLYSATFFYPPLLLNEFLKKANNVAIIMSGVACVLYFVMVDAGDCPKGIVAGLDMDYSYHPVGCGDNYQCNPSWREFAPVCVPDSLLTFFSAREAGCVQQHEINGLMVHVNCACSGTSPHAIATVGACSDSACSPAYQLHLMLFLGVVIATTISLQSQGILVLRAVNPVDKSVAIGVASSVVTICTFVVAHLSYNALRENSCLWFEDERCHLQNDIFPIWVGYTSAGLALLSGIFSLLAWRARDKTNEKDKVADEKKIN